MFTFRKKVLIRGVPHQDNQLGFCPGFLHRKMFHGHTIILFFCSGIYPFGQRHDPPGPIDNIPCTLTPMEEPEIHSLDMGYPAEILHRSIKRPMLHPGFCRALLAHPPQETAGATGKILGICGLLLPQLRKEPGECIMERTSRAYTVSGCLSRRQGCSTP